MKSKYFHLLSQYMKNHREIGTVGPDSAACVNGLLKNVPFDSSDLILEFGAATGTVTREILRRMQPESTLICFEKNAALHDRLKNAVRARNVYVVRGDAFDAPTILAERFGIPGRSVDCIVSTLPCSSLPFEDLLRAAVLPLLKTNGILIQYMHVISMLKGYLLQPILKKYFRHIDSTIVVRNLPPALIYTCRRVPELNSVSVDVTLRERFRARRTDKAPTGCKHPELVSGSVTNQT